MRLLLTLALLASPLAAQVVTRTKLEAPDQWHVDTLASVQRDLAREKGAALLVLDPEVPTAEASLAALLAEEALLPLGLRSLALDPGAGLCLELKTRVTYPPRSSRWVLLGPAGLVGEGPGFPTVPEILKAYQATGCRPRLEVVREFLNDHGEQLNAVVAVLRELKRVGDQRTRANLGNAQRVPEKGRTQLKVGSVIMSGEGEDRFVENQAALQEDADEAIWAEDQALLADRLGDLLPCSDQLPCAPASLIPECLWSSARLQAAARKVLPAVEAALAARPSSLPLWELWLALRSEGDGRSMTELLASLAPGPFTPPGRWPPAEIRTACLQDGRAHQDWKGLVDLAEPLWRNLVEGYTAHRKDFAETNLFTAGVWGDLCDPLLEALVRLHRFSEADALLKEWLALSPWKGAATRAQTIALDCGEEALMSRWSDLLGD